MTGRGFAAATFQDQKTSRSSQRSLYGFGGWTGVSGRAVGGAGTHVGGAGVAGAGLGGVSWRGGCAGARVSRMSAVAVLVSMLRRGPVVSGRWWGWVVPSGLTCQVAPGGQAPSRTPVMARRAPTVRIATRRVAAPPAGAVVSSTIGGSGRESGSGGAVVVRSAVSCSAARRARCSRWRSRSLRASVRVAALWRRSSPSLVGLWVVSRRVFRSVVVVSRVASCSAAQGPPEDRTAASSLTGELAAGAPDQVGGFNTGQQGAGLAGGQVLLRPAGDQVEQEHVQPVDQIGAGTSETVAAVDQQPQRHRGVVRGDLAQAGAAQRRDGNAVRVDRIGRAALAGGEHRPVAGGRGGEPPVLQDPFPGVDDLDGGRVLVRVHPNDDVWHAAFLDPSLT